MRSFVEIVRCNLNISEPPSDSLAIVRMTGNPANEIVPFLLGIDFPDYLVPAISWDFMWRLKSTKEVVYEETVN